MIVVKHFDWTAAIKAVLPTVSVLSGSAPQERREEMVSSAALKAADISGVCPRSSVAGYKETMVIFVGKRIN